MEPHERAATSRTIVEDNSYLTVATADADGTPWATPVWFAHVDHRRFVWVSRPDTRHSRNIAARPRVGVVIFDSTVPISTGQALYAEADARCAGDAELGELIAAYSARAVARGGRSWAAAHVTPPSEFRLYVAESTVLFALDEHDERVEVDPGS